MRNAGVDRAVSELASTLVLIAIALVIVAALGSSVLFLGEDQAGPQGQFEFDYSEDRQRLLVTYERGGTFAAGNISVQGPDDASARWSALAGDDASATIEPGDPVLVSEEGAYGRPVGPDDSIRVVYIDPASGTATVLDTWNGTDAV
ncbi:type IV pilin [Halapricum desulfuricans]|uniref:Pilin/Flagellin, FlaG/FlaF family n=1 Tax=Halapricum desulfuricans TaxID=2841257 RepID=A0A897NLE4_9EURY|nr:type IV pilin [Halapricum desulfuricans]QSG09368.1 Pilin/Flagellin, FlaG/FlaF family [Halapricum desulfuricans]QSG12265.1 Pilin/Flagellin, FlaG/FlaF family [Halapricum desulfuricans]